MSECGRLPSMPCLLLPLQSIPLATFYFHRNPMHDFNYLYHKSCIVKNLKKSTLPLSCFQSVLLTNLFVLVLTSQNNLKNNTIK